MQDSKKNYSFYMPEDFDAKIDFLRDSIDALKGLSKSQSVYFLISNLAANRIQIEPDSSVKLHDEGQ